MKKQINITRDQFDQFIQTAIITKSDYIRKGQAVFNCLASKYPDICNKLAGTPYDCYYDDDNIDIFIEAVWTDLNDAYNNLHDVDDDSKTKCLRDNIYNNHDAYHEWGDNWPYWDDLYAAINEMYSYIKKSHVLVYDKEKYGTYNFDVLQMYDGTLKSWLQPSVRTDFDWYLHSDYIYSNFPSLFKWIRDNISPIVNKFLHYISRIDFWIAYPHLPFYHYSCKEKEEDSFIYKADQWIRKNIKFIPKAFIMKVQSWQKQKINEGFQKTALKYPYIVHELVSDVNCYDWIKPYGKYILDGTVIHNMHWRTINKNK